MLLFEYIWWIFYKAESDDDNRREYITMLSKHYSSTRNCIGISRVKNNPSPRNEWIVSKTTKIFPTYALLS